MSNIATGRVKYLQREIVEAIKRTRANDTLSKGNVEEIFGNQLKDPTIKSLQKKNNEKSNQRTKSTY